MKGLLFTYVLTYGGALTSLVRPYYGLLIYVCFSIIKPESLWYWSVPEGNYSRIVALAMLVGWSIHGCGNWRLGRARVTTAALLCYLVWNIVSSLFASDEQIARNCVEELVKIVLPFLVGVTLVDSVAKLKQLAWVIFLSQGYLAFEFNFSYYFEGFNRIKEVGFAGMEEGSVAIGLVTVAGIGLFLGFSAKTWWAAAMALVLTLLMVNAVFLSFSRGGMLGLLVLAAVAFLLIPKTLKHCLLFALVLSLGLRLAGPQVQDRFSTSFAGEENRDDSAQSRLILWGNCIDAMMRNPITGLGPHHFPLYVHEYGWARGKEGHTLWLQIGAELGVPGLAFLLCFYGFTFIQLWPIARQRRPVVDPWLQHAARMVVASLAGFVVAGQFISPSAVELPYYVTLIGAIALKLNSHAIGDAAAPISLPRLALPRFSTVPQVSRARQF